MTQCENGKVGIPIADHTTADELAAPYSTVGLNGDVATGISKSITGAIYGGQQQFATSRAQLAPERRLRFISKIWT